MLRTLRRADGWSARRRAGVVTAFVALLAGVVFAWPGVDPWVRSAALSGDVVVQLPLRPLTWLTHDPVTESVEWGAGGRGLITRPDSGGPAPALVLVLGADPAPPDDPRVVRLVDALARTGFAVLFPLSDELAAKRVTPVDVDRLVEAFLALERDPAVRSDRIAFVGLSAGGSLVIVAASDARIAERVWFVQALGPYYDAASLVASTAGRAYRDGEDTRPWRPSKTTVAVVRETLLALLPAEERAAIEGGEESATAAGRAVAALLSERPLAEAEALLDALSAEMRATLEAVSPRYHLDGLRAPLYLLHDRNDRFIPWTESQAIAGALSADGPAIYHLLDIFEHVEPRPGNLPVLGRDGWRLMRLFARIFREAR